ncbi:Alg9-like mannosyltransferase [Colletotrichum paranaense]|uniref:Mannosyltransferase n=1 Tax=Colletotrichum paranaense TaxID=1914294 RepID=A0ABQ9RXK3_9PEZI|nr:Alg9-like mannosyltransferase [Colletotrichum paranaense]KAK1517575.1 Alg9-like mannosyltransferase [Colletotrichum paranaense]
MASVGSPPAPELLMAVRNEHNKPSVFRSLLVIRLLNAWWVLTFFQPDEYFQALEPAWRIAFGQGSGAWITWEWRNQLRSSLHPALFAGVYTLADLVARPLPIIRPWLLLAAPKAAQAVFAAAGDWYTWQLAVKIYGADSSVSWFALFMSMFSPFQWYCSTRTFSNSLETTLTIMALNYWPWELLGDAKTEKENPKPARSILHTPGTLTSLRLSLILAATAVLLRPTNILIWIPIALATLLRPLLSGSGPGSTTSVLTPQTILLLLREALLCGTLVLSLSLTSDRLYFGQWAFPPYKFLYFNLSQSLAVLYGRNDWHYYLSQGLPLLSMTYLPFVLLSLYNPPSPPPPPHSTKIPSKATLKTLTWTVYTTITALSTVSHKEVRFIYPLLPTLHILAAAPLASFFTTPAPPPTPRSPLPKPRLRRKRLLASALGLHAAIAFFLTLLHQPAPLTVLTFLRTSYARIHPEQAAASAPIASLALASMASSSSSSPPTPGSSSSPTTKESKGNELFALFLTPCHSTPWRSHLLHPALRARALTCEPPLHTKPDTPEREAYRDEADRFYDDPQLFMATELWPAAEARSSPESDSDSEPAAAAAAAASSSAPPEDIPRYIVGFEGIEPWLHDFFSSPHGAGHNLGVSPKRVWSGWNGFFNEDARRRGKLVVWDTGLYTTVS